jgi:hypothetical protein
MKKLSKEEKEMLEKIKKCGRLYRNEVSDIEAGLLRSLANKELIDGYTTPNNTLIWVKI